MSASLAEAVWARGRFDAAAGPGKILFGRMYEDASIELDAFRSKARVFCIASAGCTAAMLAPHHDIVAVDLNPVQLAYAERRFAGGDGLRGVVEKLMDATRFFAPLVGWSRSRLHTFVDSDDPEAQLEFWRQKLDTLRFRFAFDRLLSLTALRTVYASPLLAFLPRRLGHVMRGRMERCFARHANRDNPYAHALLLGETSNEPLPPEAKNIRPVHADAAEFLERQPRGSFDGFTLSNILDGADPTYRKRLVAAVQRAAAPGATVVLRSFGEPAAVLETNRAAEDRSMLWGSVDVRPATALNAT